MKGFTKDGKFRPTGNKTKSALKKSDVRKKGALPTSVTGDYETRRVDKLMEHNNDIGITQTLNHMERNLPTGGTQKTGRNSPSDISRRKQSIDNDSEHSMVIEILQKTDDGDELSGQHLSLVEAGANHNLNDAGKKALKDLYNDVNNGSYSLPAFHGIKNMTKDQEGYVYWKGKQVEHYSHDDYEDEKFSAKKLEANILDLEARGEEVTWGSILDNYDNLEANQNQWERTNYLVSPMNNGLVVRSSNREEGSDWIHGRDKQHALEEYVRKHPDAKFDELEVLTNEEWNKKYDPRGTNR